MSWKWYNIYQIVDIETGEILKNLNNKEWETVDTEVTYNMKPNGRFETNNNGQNVGHRYTTRVVKHKGQYKLEL